MRMRLKAMLIGAVGLALAGCAAPSDRYGQAQAETEAARGAQTAPDQTGVSVSGTARIGVTRTLN
ncbi:MAG: hypothetical protein R3197_13510 [Paracoccaceae bacterium]|nr:hypothetical protein [Paracoccaceae bacterium]